MTRQNSAPSRGMPSPPPASGRPLAAKTLGAPAKRKPPCIFPSAPFGAAKGHPLPVPLNQATFTSPSPAPGTTASPQGAAYLSPGDAFLGEAPAVHVGGPPSPPKAYSRRSGRLAMGSAFEGRVPFLSRLSPECAGRGRRTRRSTAAVFYGKMQSGTFRLIFPPAFATSGNRGGVAEPGLSHWS